MAENIIIVHGGGPTAVINSSLYGAIKEAKKHSDIDHIYGAKGGTGGLMKNELIELEKINGSDLELLLQTPGSAIGTSRDVIEEKEYLQMLKVIKERDIKYVLFNGGKLYKMAQKQGDEIFVMGIPKTMDNDIAITDHSPGFGSAARFISESVRELCADVKGLPIHVVVAEASGRNAGWITAASALADNGDGLGPDLIYLPEVPFDEDKYIEDVKTQYVV